MGRLVTCGIYYGIVVSSTKPALFDVEDWWEHVNGYSNPYSRYTQRDEFLSYAKLLPDIPVTVLPVGRRLIVASKAHRISAFDGDGPQEVILPAVITDESVVRDFARKYFKCVNEPRWLLCFDEV